MLLTDIQNKKFHVGNLTTNLVIFSSKEQFPQKILREKSKDENVRFKNFFGISLFLEY